MNRNWIANILLTYEHISVNKPYFKCKLAVGKPITTVVIIRYTLVEFLLGKSFFALTTQVSFIIKTLKADKS